MAAWSARDHALMARALRLAELGLYTTAPNPRVGCVLAHGDEVVGEGGHARAGEPHAEAHALQAAGTRSRGATAYVTLEPCAHFGRTPPCTTALIEARIGRVVAAVEDPFPQVNGQGLTQLRNAGMDVRCGLLEQEARELNIGFFARVTRGRPWVRMKIAASLDGKTALNDGRSQWITSEAARADGHAWRARACALLTGVGTVKADNPHLNVRLVDTPRQPLRVVVDSRWETDPEAKVLHGAGGVLVAGAVDDPVLAPRIEALRARGAETLALPDAHGKVDLAALMQELARRGYNEVHVEAGFRLNGALVHAGLVDELLVYLAPTLMGEAKGMVHLPALADLTLAQRLSFHHMTLVGEDLRVLARLQ